MQLGLPLEPRLTHPEPRLATPEPRLPTPELRLPTPETRITNPELRLPDPVFVRHPRARRYLIRVEDDGRVRVTVPRWGSKREAAAFAERERAWIEKQRARVAGQRTASAREPIPEEMERELRNRAKRELPIRLLELAARHALTVTRISVRNQRWRWGSCSRNGHICLNWRLVQMPDAVRDYVMIHELMHLRRMDHSPKFWKLVEAACPTFQTSRAYLRTRSHS
jgi:predicted metal-dependent hydrolase